MNVPDAAELAALGYAPLNVDGPSGQGVDFSCGPDRTVLHLQSPLHTKGWVPFRIAGIECWRDHTGREWTRALEGEVTEAIVTFTKSRGMDPLHLVTVEGSLKLTREQKKERRAQRELNRRGYA